MVGGSKHRIQFIQSLSDAAAAAVLAAAAVATAACREVGYNHYKGRMGWEMPHTAQMLAANRPEK
jgi:hypothetical protein